MDEPEVEQNSVRVPLLNRQKTETNKSSHWFNISWG